MNHVLYLFKIGIFSTSWNSYIIRAHARTHTYICGFFFVTILVFDVALFSLFPIFRSSFSAAFFQFDFFLCFVLSFTRSLFLFLSSFIFELLYHLMKEGQKLKQVRDFCTHTHSHANTREFAPPQKQQQFNAVIDEKFRNRTPNRWNFWTFFSHCAKFVEQLNH